LKVFLKIGTAKDLFKDRVCKISKITVKGD